MCFVLAYPDDASYRIWLAVLYRSAAGPLIDRGEFEPAQQWLQKVLAALEPLRDRDPPLPHVDHLLRQAYLGLEDVERRRGDSEAAAEFRRKAEGFGRPDPFSRPPGS